MKLKTITSEIFSIVFALTGGLAAWLAYRYESLYWLVAGLVAMAFVRRAYFAVRLYQIEKGKEKRIVYRSDEDA